MLYSSEYQQNERNGENKAEKVCLLLSWVLVGRPRVVKTHL
jgi:hypothetical protein